MPLGILVIGIMLLVTAVRGTTIAFGAQLKKDFIGDAQSSGFIVWVVILAILAVVGSVGASYGRKDVQKLTQVFIFVVLVALVLRTPNIAQSFVQQISTAPTTPATDAAAQPSTATVKGADASNSGGDLLSGVLGDNQGNAKSQEVLGMKTSDIGTYATYAAMVA